MALVYSCKIFGCIVVGCTEMETDVCFTCLKCEVNKRENIFAYNRLKHLS